MDQHLNPRPETTVTSQTLLARLKLREPEAWGRLTRLYGPLVYSWCRQRELQAADAADVMQEVFLAVSRGLEGFSRDGPGDSFRKWLKTITFNKIRDHWRRQKREPQAGGGTEAQVRMLQQAAEWAEAAEAAEGSDCAVNQAEINFLLQQAVEMVRSEFEPATWEAFRQTVLGGRATGDVAADLGVSANAVRVAKSRVLSRLRSEFGGLLD